jgi:hypothetical protein
MKAITFQDLSQTFRRKKENQKPVNGTLLSKNYEQVSVQKIGAL